MCVFEKEREKERECVSTASTQKHTYTYTSHSHHTNTHINAGSLTPTTAKGDLSWLTHSPSWPSAASTPQRPRPQQQNSTHHSHAQPVRSNDTHESVKGLAGEQRAQGVTNSGENSAERRVLNEKGGGVWESELLLPDWPSVSSTPARAHHTRAQMHTDDREMPGQSVRVPKGAAGSAAAAAAAVLKGGEATAGRGVGMRGARSTAGVSSSVPAQQQQYNSTAGVSSSVPAHMPAPSPSLSTDSWSIDEVLEHAFTQTGVCVCVPVCGVRSIR